ncbi:MAG: prolyl oligopeptidase family serine peptidase [Cyclobacteriaceae bacterium]
MKLFIKKLSKSVKRSASVTFIFLIGTFQIGLGQAPIPIIPKSAYDTLHGMIIDDPFLFFEDSSNVEAREWIEQKNVEAETELSGQPNYTTLFDSISALMASTPIRATIPMNNNGVIYTQLDFEETGQTKLVKYDTITEPYQVLLTNELFTVNGKVYEIFDYNPSPDNRYIALQLYPQGFDDMIIRVYDSKTRNLTEDIIDASTSYYPFWLPDSKSFFYTQLTSPLKFDSVQVKRHIIGNAQQMDQLVLDRKSSDILSYNDGDFPAIQMLPDKKRVVCSMAYGISQYIDHYVAPLEEILEDQPTSWQHITSLDQQIITSDFTQNNAYLLRAEPDSTTSIVYFDLQEPGKAEVLINEKEGFIAAMMIEEDALYYEKSYRGFSELIRVNLEDQSTSTIQLPFQGDLVFNTESPARMNGPGLFFGLSSWSQGYGIYYVHPESDSAVKTTIRPAGKYETPDSLIVEQVLVQSHDSTKVPLTIIYKEGVERKQVAPVILEAYGAYGISLDPLLQVESLLWLDQGGILAKAHVRGGGENGPQWHTDGRKKTKPNSWKDLIACAQFLIQEKYTTADQLGVMGASAGGIAVGMALNEAPELFGAAVLSYPLVNPARMEAEEQYDEFGNPNDSLEFSYLYQMDSYFNLSSDNNYPPVLLISGVTDPRVPLWSVAKYAARLQQVSDHPVLFRVYQAGHGTQGQDYVQELADRFAFFMWQLNTTPD